MKARLQHRYKRARRWFAQPGGRGDIVGALAAFAILVVGALVVLNDDIGDERRDRAQERAEDRARVDRVEEALDRRLVRIELGSPDLCRRSARCSSALRVRRQRERQQRRERRERDEARQPEQRADRPPRQPTVPAPMPEPVAGGPPDPPGTATPSTPAAPAGHGPVVRVDPPVVDVDGPNGLAPNLLPNVNLPPVDLPPVEIPRLRR